MSPPRLFATDSRLQVIFISSLLLVLGNVRQLLSLCIRIPFVALSVFGTDCCVRRFVVRSSTQLHRAPMKGFPEGFRMVECIVNDSSSTQALCRQHQSYIEQQFNAIAPPAPTTHVQPNTATIPTTTPSFIQMLRMKINGSYQMERQTKEIMIHK